MSLRHALPLSAAVGAALLLGFVGLASADDYGPLKVMATSAGKVLVDPKGMTLYTFDKDKAGMSNCYGECEEYWPPALASADAKPVGDLTLVKRKDGKMQWADDGKPLYTFAADKKPGDVNGDNKNNVWHVVKE
jgi:predicted lipoprotein with Yx(FWY)xxD motif